MLLPLYVHMMNSNNYVIIYINLFTHTLIETLFGLKRLGAQHRQAEISNLNRETAIDHTIRTIQIAMTFYLATVQENHAFYNIMNEMILKVGFEFDLLIFEYILIRIMIFNFS